VLSPHDIINQHCQDLAYIAYDLKKEEKEAMRGRVVVWGGRGG
jgi:hypothetical protein